jgi:putative transposase
LRCAGRRTDESHDNAIIESFWPTIHHEPLDRRRRQTRHQLATAIFKSPEGYSNPIRHHTATGSHSPADYQARYTPNVTADAA